MLSFQYLDINAIKREITGLEELARQLFLEIVDLQRTLDRIAYSKTFEGKYFNCLGIFFSIYCLWKLCIVCSERIYLTFCFFF